MNDKEKVVKLYREIRQDHVARYAGNGAIYHHKVTAQASYDAAKRIVDIRSRWQEAEDQGLVRLNVVPDYCTDDEYLFGDTYDPDVNSDIRPAVLARQKKEAIERIDRDGVWGIESEFYDGEEWVSADRIWGFVGDDWKDSGSDLDVCVAALDKLAALEFCPTCNRPKKEDHHVLFRSD
jgi:hypothetical protein